MLVFFVNKKHLFFPIQGYFLTPSIFLLFFKKMKVTIEITLSLPTSPQHSSKSLTIFLFFFFFC